MLRIYTHNVGSEGLNNLRTGINDAVNNLNSFMRRNHQGIAPRSSRAILASEVAGAPGFNNGNRVVLCWGNSSPLTIHDSNLYLNNPTAIGLATNKKTFFETIDAYNEELEHSDMISLPEWTDSTSIAEDWAEEGIPVYCRTQLQGHSGSGIVVASDESEIVDAPLYTQGITGARREYRIHVFGDEILFAQVKRRRSGVEVNEEVRNLDGGWVFGVTNVAISREVKRNAIAAVKALGLTFGAVDILAKGRAGQEEEVYVLEINTAPGQQGDTTIAKYGCAIIDAMLRFYVSKVDSDWIVDEMSTEQLLNALGYSEAGMREFFTLLPVTEAQVALADEDDEVAASVQVSPWDRLSIVADEDTSRQWQVSTASTGRPRPSAIPTRAPAAPTPVAHTAPTSTVRTSALTASGTDNYYAVGTVAGQQKVGMVVPSRGLFYMTGVDAPVMLTNVTLTARIEL